MGSNSLRAAISFEIYCLSMLLRHVFTSVCHGFCCFQCCCGTFSPVVSHVIRVVCGELWLLQKLRAASYFHRKIPRVRPLNTILIVRGGFNENGPKLFRLHCFFENRTLERYMGRNKKLNDARASKPAERKFTFPEDASYETAWKRILYTLRCCWVECVPMFFLFSIKNDVVQ